VRAVITYLILLVAARAMGKRVAGQMSVLELTIIVTLGAAIGVPLETPERGLLAAIVVLAIAVGYQRLVGLATFQSRRAVGVLEGRPETLVRDGAIELDTMKRAGISRERLFALLRNHQVLQLGRSSACTSRPVVNSASTAMTIPAWACACSRAPIAKPTKINARPRQVRVPQLRQRRRARSRAWPVPDLP
jgi:hypothetical protein